MGPPHPTLPTTRPPFYGATAVLVALLEASLRDTFMRQRARRAGGAYVGSRLGRCFFFCFVLPSAAFGQTPPAPPPQCFFTRSKREKTPRSASGRRRRRPERVLKKKKTLKGVNSFFIFLPPRHSLLRRPGYHRAEDRAGTGTARCRFVNGERHVTFRLSTGRGPETRDLGAAMCVRGVDVH